ncbi:MAG: galactose mutarotase [Tabrizicola sp.]|nr:galactose mutarotase [Tabrizicola sp.]
MGISRFGVTARGHAVQRIVLGAGDLRVAVITLGAALQDVRLGGIDRSLTIGSEDLALYEGALRHHGTLIGPVVNRITGAAAQIDGTLHRFATGPGEPVILHSGAAGTHRKVWTLAEMSENAVTLTLEMPDGEGGFPGNRHVSARYTLTAPATLTLDLSVRTDRTTVINFANHSYWNLDGGETFAGHRLAIAADRYLPATPLFTPTGEIAPVDGSAYDFRMPRLLEPGDPPLDTNFCLSDARRGLTDVLSLTGRSGLRLTMATTEPGLQVYDFRNPLGSGLPAWHGLALEAQLWPDAPGRPGFPPIDLAPGQIYAPVTQWRFDRM